MGAVTAGTAATGMKAYLQMRAPGLLTDANMRRATNVALAGLWILGAGLLGAGGT